MDGEEWGLISRYVTVAAGFAEAGGVAAGEGEANEGFVARVGGRVQSLRHAVN